MAKGPSLVAQQARCDETEAAQLDLIEAYRLPHVDDKYSRPQLRREGNNSVWSMEEGEAEKIRPKTNRNYLESLLSTTHTAAAQQTDEIEPTTHKWQPTNSG